MQEEIDQEELPPVTAEVFDEFGEFTGVPAGELLEVMSLAYAASPPARTTALDLVVRALASLAAARRLGGTDARLMLDVGCTLAYEMRNS